MTEFIHAVVSTILNPTAHLSRPTRSVAV